MDLKVQYQPSSGQAEFHGSPAKYKAMIGALGSGKTATLCVEGITLSLEFPGNVGLIARKTLPELKTTTMKRFFEYLPDPLIQNYNKTDRELTIRNGTATPSTVYFGPLDELSRYKSLELGWFGVDEADEMTEEMWLTLCGRLRFKGVPTYGMLASNPTSTNHWIYRRWIASPTEGYAVFRSKTSDNVANLPEHYIDDLRKNYPDDWQKRFIDGHFGVIQSGDPCFPDFKESLHVKSLSPTKGLPIYRGWDFGRRRPCVVFAQITDAGQLKVLRTMLGENEDLYQFSDRVLRFSQKTYLGFVFEDFCDIAGKQERDSGKSSLAILQQDRKIFPRFRYSKPEDRIREMRRMMRERVGGEETFQIDPANLYLIEALLGGLTVDEDGRPRKEGYFEHGIDALGYIIANTCMVEIRPEEGELIDIAEYRWAIGAR